jgi:hypothetical protein
MGIPWTSKIRPPICPQDEGAGNPTANAFDNQIHQPAGKSADGDPCHQLIE